ncbi:MAG: site-specific integrase [Spirochaetaceae bacterium]|nr:site-specific integrase [Spirochaetaceae bacterium]
MIAHDEKVQKTSGQRDWEMDKEKQKVLGKTAIGKYYQEKNEPLPSCKKNTWKADIFTIEELRGYFNPDIYGDPDLYLFYLCCLTAGLRPGEGRGLRSKQILFDKEALIVDGFIGKNGARTTYNKEGAGKYWKHRIVPLPELTLRLLKEHIERNRLKDDDFCFTPKKDPSRPVTEWYLRNHMERIIKKAGIQQQERKLGLDSFRFTYAAHLWQEIPAGIVMQLVGRKTFGMMEQYNKRDIDGSLAEFIGAELAVGKLFAQSGETDHQGLFDKLGLDIGNNDIEIIMRGN